MVIGAIKRLSRKDKLSKRESRVPVPLLSHYSLKPTLDYEWQDFWFRYLEAGDYGEFSAFSNLRQIASKGEPASKTIEYMYNLLEMRKTHQIKLAESQQVGGFKQLLYHDKRKAYEDGTILTEFEEMIVNGSQSHPHAFTWLNPQTPTYKGPEMKGYSYDFEIVCMMYNYSLRSAQLVVENKGQKEPSDAHTIMKSEACIRYIQAKIAENEWEDKYLTHDIHEAPLTVLREILKAQFFITMLEARPQSNIRMKIRVLRSILSHLSTALETINNAGADAKYCYPHHFSQRVSETKIHWEEVLDTTQVQFLLQKYQKKEYNDMTELVGQIVHHYTALKDKHGLTESDISSCDELVEHNALIYHAVLIPFDWEQAGDFHVVAKIDPSGKYAELDFEQLLEEIPGGLPLLLNLT